MRTLNRTFPLSSLLQPRGRRGIFQERVGVRVGMAGGWDLGIRVNESNLSTCRNLADRIWACFGENQVRGPCTLRWPVERGRSHCVTAGTRALRGLEHFPELCWDATWPAQAGQLDDKTTGPVPSVPLTQQLANPKSRATFLTDHWSQTRDRAQRSPAQTANLQEHSQINSYRFKALNFGVCYIIDGSLYALEQTQRARLAGPISAAIATGTKGPQSHSWLWRGILCGILRWEPCLWLSCLSLWQRHSSQHWGHESEPPAGHLGGLHGVKRHMLAALLHLHVPKYHSPI